MALTTHFLAGHSIPPNSRFIQTTPTLLYVLSQGAASSAPFIVPVQAGPTDPVR